jgi:hypothetical protein
MAEGRGFRGIGENSLRWEELLARGCRDQEAKEKQGILSPDHDSKMTDGEKWWEMVRFFPGKPV